MRCSSKTRFWRFPHFMFKFNPMSMRKIKYVMAKQLLSTQAVSTGAEKQATAKAPCFKRPHDAFLDLREHCLEKKCTKHVLSNATSFGAWHVFCTSKTKFFVCQHSSGFLIKFPWTNTGTLLSLDWDGWQQHQKVFNGPLQEGPRVPT